MDAGKFSGLQESVENRFRNIGKGKYGRILKMARTPTPDEYKKTIAITGIGIILLGALGFAIMWLMNYLPGYF
ncbi:MAG: protein translocase SEC61 complex subunit gamma [Thermoplasmatales archaeon]|nr:protein translocase SEC61 complex subunit gamma [Thermoplasmatales archaeon]